MSTTYTRDRVLWIKSLTQKRLALGLSIREVERRYGIPRTTIRRWETFEDLPKHKRLAFYNECLRKYERDKQTGP